ncbi:MAG: histidine-type phosphatase, partial [Bacteroidales bacterium]
CNGKWGNLSIIGENQLRGIAQRMLTNFPDLFKDHIYVQSDIAERCVKSMEAFINEFYKKVSKEQISIELLPEQNAILNFFDINLAYLEYKKSGSWRDLYHNFADSVLQNQRPVRALFVGEYADTMSNKIHFMHALYSTYAILPDTDISVSLQDYFTGEELFSLWNVENVRQYLEKGPSPESKGLAINMSFPLLEDFLVTTYNAIAEGEVSADFRFAHAETIIPFAALLEIPIASQKESDLNLISTKWLDFQISPMAANIQWILYSNDTGHYLIKMLFNEKEVSFPIESATAPYYDWDEVRSYYQNILDSLPIIPSFSTERQVRYYKEQQ